MLFRLALGAFLVAATVILLLPDERSKRSRGEDVTPSASRQASSPVAPGSFVIRDVQDHDGTSAAADHQQRWVSKRIDTRGTTPAKALRGGDLVQGVSRREQEEMLPEYLELLMRVDGPHGSDVDRRHG